MKNTKTKIILSAIIFLSVVGFVGTVNATGASLYVSPASLTKTAGNTFSVSVGFNASGSKVCAVEGTLVFNNLTCQSITVADDVMAQSSPTCSNPHFLIGIPSCATADKVLFTASVKAGSAGTASINFTGVDIIGEGVSVGSASISGNYTINLGAEEAEEGVEPAFVPPGNETSASKEEEIEGEKEPASAEVTAGKEEEEKEETVGGLETPELVEVGVEKPTGLGKFLAAIGAFSLNLKVILLIIALILIGLFILWLIKKKKERK